MIDRLAYSVRELQAELGVGRTTALRLANEIGIRISPRRIVVPRVRLERWLEGGDEMAPNGAGKDEAPDLDAASRA